MTLAVIAAGGIVIGLGLLLMLAQMSKSGEAPGLLSGRLHPCSSRPNGVCSEFPEDASHYVPPLEFAAIEPDEAWQALRTAIGNSGGTIISDQRPYLAATYTSSLFGFVDDFECRLDEASQVIHIRSASRVGHSDLGANRRRVAAVARAFSEALGKQADPSVDSVGAGS